MKCQILFSGTNKKKNIIYLSYAELAQGVVKVKEQKTLFILYEFISFVYFQGITCVALSEKTSSG